jgi:two-component system, chemotaxis family, sensor kinase CheA
MNALLEQFLSEGRDCLQGIGEKLMQLEDAPDDAELMIALFRLVHTLKGNSGLFDFPEMTRVLHAGEDLMDAVRHGRAEYSKDLADRLLDAMDFVGMLCDEIEKQGQIGAVHAADSARLAESLRQLIPKDERAEAARQTLEQSLARRSVGPETSATLPLLEIPEAARMAAYRRGQNGAALYWLSYSPAEEAFFQGDDPFFQARGTPDLLWGSVSARQPWPSLAALDAYRCALDFHLLSAAPRVELDEYYRYMPDQVSRVPVPALFFALPQGSLNGGSVYESFVAEARSLLEAGELAGLERAIRAQLELSKPQLWFSSALRWLLLVIELDPQNRAALGVLIESLRRLSPPEWRLEPGEGASNNPPPPPAPPPAQAKLSAEEAEVLAELVEVQRTILLLPIEADWQLGRIQAVSATLAGCLRARVELEALPELAAATASALQQRASAPLLAWLGDRFEALPKLSTLPPPSARTEVEPKPSQANRDRPPAATRAASDTELEPKAARRAEDTNGGHKTLKVDQAKIDLLMNLIGEMVVSKNALPYLAGRAETVFGARELAREIKAQYVVINRIAEEMQDAIMQVRMMPVSFVFQRFPRLVRDTSRKLGKEVNLVLEGDDTEADKNIIESLGDPLVHIVRNSLDHGFELPEVRRAAGKPAAGTLTISASQEADRVVIEISDDGKGIDPAVVKLKAYEKGLIEESALERLSDQEAVNLVFASGFSTADVVSDLSGRGVGMDAVRTAVEKVNGTVALHSEKGKGTRIRLSLPLSMAVTNVMIVESDRQVFGVPMESVVETVRVPRRAVRTIKKSLATVLRGRVVPLKSINTLLGLSAAPKPNDQDELAVLVVRLGTESVGLLVDDFHETADIILKPMTGVLAGLSAYSGSALMGDGSVLMVLNVKEMLQ